MLKLNYFNGRGMAETSRLILAAVGAEYEDFRYPLEIIDWSTYNFVRKEFDEDKNLALQTLFYNKRNNISIIGELESLITETKTKVFCDICKNYNLDLNQKILLIVSNKTTPLKLSTQNLKNVELISASNLNTLSLLKAKQILLTPLAVNDIKEIYCD